MRPIGDQAPLLDPVGKVKSRTPAGRATKQSDGNVVCAGQRMNQEG